MTTDCATLGTMDLDATNPKADVIFTGWAFIGFTEHKQHPIGVYQKYCDGAAHANSWMKSTPKAVRWEGSKLYEENTDA